MIDTVSQDEVIEAGFDAEALEKAKGLVPPSSSSSRTHKDEITALQVLYSLPYQARLRFEEIKELAEALHRPPHLLANRSSGMPMPPWSEQGQGSGGEAHSDRSRVAGPLCHAPGERAGAVPEKVQVNFAAWLGQQQASGRRFTDEQRKWLEMIRDHIAANLEIEAG